MSGFEPLELKWGGVTYTIAPHKMMGALQRFERAITPQDFMLLTEGGMGAAPSVCASAYGALLRYAGARVSDQDVYLACRDEEAELPWAGETAAAVMDTIVHLQMLRLPPKERERIEAAIDEAAGDADKEADTAERMAAEPEPANPTNAAPASSKQPTKRQSAADG